MRKIIVFDTRKYTGRCIINCENDRSYIMIPMTRIIGDEVWDYTIAYEIMPSINTFIYSLQLQSLTNISKNIKGEHKTLIVYLSALWFALVVGLVSTLVLFFGANFFATVVNNDPKAILPIRVLAPTLFVFSIMGVLRGFYQGKNTMIPTAVSQIIEQIVNAFVSILGAYFFMKSFSASTNIAAYGAAGATLGTLIGAIAGLLFLVFVYILYRPVLNRQIKKDRSTYLDSYKDIYK